MIMVKTDRKATAPPTCLSAVGAYSPWRLLGGESNGLACRLRHRQDGWPVDGAIDMAYWCQPRRRQVAFAVDGVADRCQFLPVAYWEEGGDGYGGEEEG
jgi:hypothetical protein